MARWASFRGWARNRPFIGGLLFAFAGVELFFSGQLDIGNIHVQLGIEGLQSTVIPVALVLLGILAITMPQHHIFYGVIGLVLSVYTLVGLNLGGFFIGMLLGSVGGILVVSWMSKPAVATEPTVHDEEVDTELVSASAREGDFELVDTEAPALPLVSRR
jgi:hypothetical protein